MKIEITSPMIEAFRSGADTYTPIFDGKPLEVECGSPEISLRNLSKLVGPKRRVIGFHGAHRQVLVVFDTGETYIATGFGFGHNHDEVLRFAEFASKNGFGDVRDIQGFLGGLDPNYQGAISSPQMHLDTDIA